MKSLFALICAGCTVSSVISSRIYSNINTGRMPRSDMIQRSRALPDTMHECVFDIKASNLDALREKTESVSFPKSPSFGKHLTRSEVSKLTANPEATSRVLNFLSQHSGIEVVKRSRDGDKITVKAPVATWERLFSTEFYVFDRIGIDGTVDKSFIRALEYEIPAILDNHVNAVFNTVQMPPTSRPSTGIASGLYKLKADIPAPGLLQDGMVTPQLLNNFCKLFR